MPVPSLGLDPVGLGSGPPHSSVYISLLQKFGRDLADPRIRGTDSIINLARILVVQIQLIQNPARWLVGQNVMIKQPSCSCPGHKPTDLFQNSIVWLGSCTVISNFVSVCEY